MIIYRLFPLVCVHTTDALPLWDQVISFLRGPFLLAFNFHPTNSYERYTIGVEEAGEYQVSDIAIFTLVLRLLDKLLEPSFYWVGD